MKSGLRRLVACLLNMKCAVRLAPTRLRSEWTAVGLCRISGKSARLSLARYSGFTQQGLLAVVVAPSRSVLKPFRAQPGISR